MHSNPVASAQRRCATDASRGCVSQVTTEEERVKFTEQLSEAEDWLYGDGETADAAEFSEKLRALQVVGKPITRRAVEAEARPEVSLPWC